MEMKFCQSCGMPLTDGLFYSDFYPRSFIL